MSERQMCWVCKQDLSLEQFKRVSPAGVRHDDRDVCIKNLMERLAEAEALLGRTADGKAFGTGSKVYYQDPTGYVQGLDVTFMFCTDSSVPETVYHPYPVFSSLEEAAKGGREG